MLNLFISIITILIGAVLGSFIGALTYRLPRGLGFVKGRSFCDNCHKPLGWLDNIPVVSYLFLGGKSSCCNKPISFRYPVIEFLTAISAFLVFGYTQFPLSIIYFLILAVCIAIIVIDMEHQIIFDESVWILLGLSLVLNFNQDIMPHLFSGFLASFLILLIHLFTKGRGMGLGDVKLSVALGSYFLPINMVNWLFGAFLTGGVVAFILLLLGRARLKQKIAFGPFLVVAFLYIYFINLNV